MKIAFTKPLVSLASILFCLTSCNSDQDSTIAVLILDVYDPDNPGMVVPAGEFSSQQVRVFLDGQLLGTTPITFTSQRLRELGLPEYQKIDHGGEANWITWSTEGSSRLVVTDPIKQDQRRGITLLAIDDEGEVPISNLLTQPTGAKGVRISVAIKETEKKLNKS